MKVALVLALVLVVLPLLILAGASLALDPLIESKVPARMSEALGVPVTLNEADATLGGDLELKQLAVANPEGFEDPRALRVGRISAEAKPLSLLSDVVKVETLRIERPLLTIEFDGLRSNIQGLIDNLPPRDREKGKRFRIGRLTIEGATVRFASEQLPGGTKTVTLPTLEMTNVGTAEGAASMGQVAGEVLQALLRESLKHAAELPAELLQALGRTAENKAGELLEGAKDALEEVPGLLEDEVRRGLEDLQKRKAE